MRNTVSFVWAGMLLPMLFACGCGGSGGGGGGGTVTNQAVGASISPAATTLPISGAQVFTVTVTGTTSTAVTCVVLEGDAGGRIASVYPAGNGVTSITYLAPVMPGTYHVRATSQADPRVAVTATVVIVVPQSVTVAINPTSVTLSSGGTQAFTASVGSTGNTAVTWRVSEGNAGGSITSSGLYTAPATPGTYHVLATSQVDPSKSASAIVTVTPPSFSQVIQPTPTFADATNRVAPSVYLVFAVAKDGAYVVGTGFAVQFKDGLQLLTAGHVANGIYQTLADPTATGAFALQYLPDGSTMSFPITKELVDTRYDPNAPAGTTVDLGYLLVGPGKHILASGGAGADIQTPPTTANIAQAATLSAIQVPQSMGILGYPGNLLPQQINAGVAYPTFQPENLLEETPITGSAAHLIYYDLPITQGFSGGPVFLPTGEVVGVVSANTTTGLQHGVAVYLDALWTRARVPEQRWKPLPTCPLPADWRQRLSRAKFL